MYQAPLKDLRFVLGDLLRVQDLAALPRYAEFSSEIADSILEQAARFAEQVLAPINILGDTQGARFSDGSVQMPAEFR
ncbi:MAG TPA: acyl-CoA dehydrogenase N-terminal domain-containing protein, partial [Steroidobacteraceae bacterium]